MKDKDDPNVERGGDSAGLFDAPAGSIVSNNHATWTYSNNRSVENSMKWKPPLDQCGRWEVYAYIAFINNSLPDATGAQYKIRHRSGTTPAGIEETYPVNLDQVNQSLGKSSDRWVSLGTYLWSKDAGNVGEYVFLGDTTGVNGQSIIFDDMRWEFRSADDAVCNPPAQPTVQPTPQPTAQPIPQPTVPPADPQHTTYLPLLDR